MDCAGSIIHGDCLDVLRTWPDKSVDLVLGSPPYEAARTYGIDFKLRGQAWVDWMTVRMIEMARVSRGLVAMVVAGQTRQFKWSATPALLIADLHRAGLNLRNPAIFHRVGIPGSGGPDWLRSDYEWIVCVSQPGKLAWSDNTAMGHAPKYGPGGEMSYRNSNGTRRNAYGFTPHVEPSETQRRNGVKRGRKGDASGKPMRMKRNRLQGDRGGHTTDGVYEWTYIPPVKANPGNVLKLIVGGGVMGSRLCHENEAPFPEALAEFFIRSFCPAAGIVCDPFTGSGTTLAVAERLNRKWVGIDVRESQCDLSLRRVAEVAPHTPEDVKTGTNEAV